MKNETKQTQVFRTPYKDRLRVCIDTGNEGGAKQEFKDECDINNIIRRYQKTGIIEHVRKYQGVYADVADAVDYQTAQNIIIAADQAFNSLNSKIRAKFNNEPVQFLAFVQDPKNKEEMRTLGLLKHDAALPEKIMPKEPEKPVLKQKTKPKESEDFDPSD